MGTVEQRQDRHELPAYKVIFAIAAVLAYILFLGILICVMLLVSPFLALGRRKTVFSVEVGDHAGDA